MSDTSGPTSALPSMRYDLASSSWRTSEATSLWDLEMSSPTFPEWGMTRGGELYELPTPERPTVAPASSLLPSPISRDHKEQTLGWTWQRDGVTQEDTLPRAITSLLPTPSANDTTGAETAEARAARAAGGPMLRDIPALLPTPTVMDMGANYTPEQWAAWKAEQKANHANGNGHGASLTQEAISLLPTPLTTDYNTPASEWGQEDRLQLRDVATLLGASTPPRLPAGSASSGDPHPAPPSPAPTDDLDLLPLSWNG